MEESGHWLKKENVIEESKKYSSKSEFQKSNNSAYQSARKNGWLDEMTWLSRPKAHNFKWTKEMVFEESRKYSSRNEFNKKNVSAYQVANKNNWLCEMVWLKTLKKKWDKKEILEESKKYSSRGEYQKENSIQYQYALKHKWLDDMVWLQNKIKPKGFWKEDANIIAESKKYTTKSEFIKQSRHVYDLARKRGLLKNMTWLYSKDNGVRYFVYCYIDEENYVVYVGLTSNIKDRHQQHSSGTYKGKKSKSSVFEYFTNIGKNIPKPIILLYNLTDLEGQYWEDFYTREFMANGFIVLNVGKTGVGCGSLGKTRLKWTDEKLIEESKKYSSRSDFEKGNCSAYHTSLKRKLMDNMVWLVPKRKKK